MFCYAPTSLEVRVEKVIKGEIMPQIFCSKKICIGSEAEKVHPKHLCAWTKQIPLLFKAAVLGLRELMCSTHSTSTARTRSHVSVKSPGTQYSGYCRTSRYLNKTVNLYWVRTIVATTGWFSEWNQKAGFTVLLNYSFGWM